MGAARDGQPGAVAGGEGRAGEARERLVASYDWFSEGFDIADLMEARALLKTLED